MLHLRLVLPVALATVFTAGCQNGLVFTEPLPTRNEREATEAARTSDSTDSSEAIRVAAVASNAEATRSEQLLAELNDETARTVMVVAHRGCWSAAAPENSMAAMRRCDAIGADIVEIDVGVTADGTPVLMHDETVDRTTDGSGAIIEMPLEQVRGLRLRSGLGGADVEMTDETIPTLEEALAYARGRFLVNLDMKAEAFDRAYEVVEALGMQDQTLMKMSALPDDPMLRNARFVGRTLFMPIIRECTGQIGGLACTDAISALAPDFSRYDPVAYEIVYSASEFLREGVSAMQALGGRIWVNTLDPTLAGGHTDALAVTDPDAHWGEVIRDGANIIQTDQPALLLDYLQRQGLRSN